MFSLKSWEKIYYIVCTPGTNKDMLWGCLKCSVYEKASARVEASERGALWNARMRAWRRSRWLTTGKTCHGPFATMNFAWPTIIKILTTPHDCCWTRLCCLVYWPHDLHENGTIRYENNTVLDTSLYLRIILFNLYLIFYFLCTLLQVTLSTLDTSFSVLVTGFWDFNSVIITQTLDSKLTYLMKNGEFNKLMLNRVFKLNL